MCNTQKPKHSMTDKNSRPVNSILMSVEQQTRKRFAKKENQCEGLALLLF